jgi:hypothetical protein
MKFDLKLPKTLVLKKLSRYRKWNRKAFIATLIIYLVSYHLCALPSLPQFHFVPRSRVNNE